MITLDGDYLDEQYLIEFRAEPEWLVNTLNVKQNINIWLAYLANPISKRLYLCSTKSFSTYSYLSNKREVKLTDFEKFHPPQKKSTLHVY